MILSACLLSRNVVSVELRRAAPSSAESIEFSSRYIDFRYIERTPRPLSPFPATARSQVTGRQRIPIGGGTTSQLKHAN